MRSKRAPHREFWIARRCRWASAHKRVSRALIAAIAVLTLGLGVRQDLQVSASLLTPTAVSQATAADRQDMCLFQAFRRELPRGATFYDGAELAHFQQLAELATLWAVPEPTPAAARWRVAVGPGQCAGVGLKVWRA
jgi:hypothetical protein